MILPYYGNNILELGIFGLVFFSLSFVLSIFSPLGIGFIISTIARWRSESESSKKLAFIFQLVFMILTFLAGLVISFLAPMLVMGNSAWTSYNLSRTIIILLSILFGVGFAGAIEIGVTIWQGKND